MRYEGMDGRVAIVTGANHGIGAATAQALAANGVRVVLSYLQLNDPAEPGIPGTYRTNRARDAAWIVESIRQSGGQAEAVEADLRDPSTPAVLFDVAERAFGQVEILVNNATGWRPDSFRPEPSDRLGRRLEPVSAASATQLLEVDARGSALMIAEFARRHVARGATWGRIVGLTSGGPLGFPEEVSYGAAKAALVNYAMSAALELAEYGITSNVVYPPVTDTGWVTPAVREFVAASREHFHVAQPEEVADMIVFLASDQARLVTANILHLR
ncbi:MAG: SDR family oxidoreductase [Chloroflexota bacterium]|nr:SDR family oxidoreductase [Chloroflexota bacterium]